MGFLTVTSGAVSDAPVRFTGENLTKSVVIMIFLSCLNDWFYDLMCYDLMAREGTDVISGFKIG